MRNDGLQFLVVQLFNYSLRQSHRVCTVIDSTSKCIERFVVYYVYLRHFHALAHAEVLDQIVDTFVALSLQRFSPRGRLDYQSIEKICYYKPYQDAPEGIRCRLQENGVGIIP